MSVHPALTDEQEKALLRKCWYSHDARWFMAVAQELGMEAANTLNRRVCRWLGEAEMRRMMRALDTTQVSTAGEMIQLFNTGLRLLIGPLMEYEGRALNDHTFELVVHRCFIHENVVRASIGESYVCAVLDRLQGWHDALGLSLTEEPPALPCAKLQGQECRRVITFQPQEP